MRQCTYLSAYSTSESDIRFRCQILVHHGSCDGFIISIVMHMMRLLSIIARECTAFISLLLLMLLFVLLIIQVLYVTIYCEILHSTDIPTHGCMLVCALMMVYTRHH